MPGRPLDIRNLHPRLTVDRRALRVALHGLDRHRRDLSTPAGILDRGAGRESLAVTFLTDPALARLHDRFLGDPARTDVITFPAEPGFGAAGEICVSADAAIRAAGTGPAFEAELALYVIHGWLHLAGHDDRDPASKRRMRRAERKALAALRVAHALPVFLLRGCPPAAVE